MSFCNSKRFSFSNTNPYYVFTNILFLKRLDKLEILAYTEMRFVLMPKADWHRKAFNFILDISRMKYKFLANVNLFLDNVDLILLLDQRWSKLDLHLIKYFK